MRTFKFSTSKFCSCIHFQKKQKQITRTFRHLDRAGEGRLTVKHVREHMEHRGEPVPEDLEEIFRNIEDLTRQGNDEGDPGPRFTTFIAATMKRHLYKDKLVLKEVFTLLAQGGNEITAITLAAVYTFYFMIKFEIKIF